MRVILSAAGRAGLRDAGLAFLALATGIFAAPNLDQAAALAGAASIAALVAGTRAIRVFIPSISNGIARILGVKTAYAEVVATGLTTLGIGFLTLVEGVLSAPNLDGAKAVSLAAILAAGTSIVRLAQAFFTPGETPNEGSGITVPAQPVPPEALPTTT